MLEILFLTLVVLFRSLFELNSCDRLQYMLVTRMAWGGRETGHGQRLPPGEQSLSGSPKHANAPKLGSDHSGSAGGGCHRVMEIGGTGSPNSAATSVRSFAQRWKRSKATCWRTETNCPPP